MIFFTPIVSVADISPLKGEKTLALKFSDVIASAKRVAIPQKAKLPLVNYFLWQLKCS